MAQHKHAATIKAWADGAQIESKTEGGDWRMTPANWPLWSEATEYRVAHPNNKYFDAMQEGKKVEWKSKIGGRWTGVANEYVEGVGYFQDDYEYRIAHHKHQACIDAWEAGKTVQVKNVCSGAWNDIAAKSCGGRSAWNEDFEYRIKPDTMRVVVVLMRNRKDGLIWVSPWLNCVSDYTLPEHFSNDSDEGIRILFDKQVEV